MIVILVRVCLVLLKIQMFKVPVLGPAGTIWQCSSLYGLENFFPFFCIKNNIR